MQINMCFSVQLLPSDIELLMLHYFLPPFKMLEGTLLEFRHGSYLRGLGWGEQWRIGVPHPTGYPGSASGGDFEDVVQELHVLLFRFALSAVADPGFPVGGTPTHWGGANF